MRGQSRGRPGESDLGFNFGATGVSRFNVLSTVPQFYALKPLSRQLLTRTVAIRPYRSGCGFCAPVYKKFDSVDLDTWMTQFLSTVDLFLETPYSVPAFQLAEPGAERSTPVSTTPDWQWPLASLTSTVPSAKADVREAGYFRVPRAGPGLRRLLRLYRRNGRVWALELRQHRQL